MSKHVRINISIEERLLNMINRHSPYNVSHTIEKALQEWLLNHCKVYYKLEEDRKKQESRFDVEEEKRTDLGELKNFLRNLRI